MKTTSTTKTTKKKEDLRLAGSIEYIDESEIGDYGYVSDFENHPVLVYNKSGDITKTDEMLLSKSKGFQVNDIYHIINDYMIKKKYTVSETEEKYPELFI